MKKPDIYQIQLIASYLRCECSYISNFTKKPFTEQLSHKTLAKLESGLISDFKLHLFSGFSLDDDTIRHIITMGDWNNITYEDVMIKRYSRSIAVNTITTGRQILGFYEQGYVLIEFLPTGKYISLINHLRQMHICIDFLQLQDFIILKNYE